MCKEPGRKAQACSTERKFSCVPSSSVFGLDTWEVPRISEKEAVAMKQGSLTESQKIVHFHAHKKCTQQGSGIESKHVIQ